MFHWQTQLDSDDATALATDVALVGILIKITTAASGIAAVIIRQNGMLFGGGDKRATAEGAGASNIFCMVLGAGLGFGAALALSVPTIPIPEISPSERIIAINFSGIDKLFSIFHIK